MNTDIEVFYLSESEIVDLQKTLEEHFECFEQRYSRFRKDSELSQLNREASKQMSSDFCDLFTLVCRLYQQTKGAFNPLVSVKRLGYVHSYLKPEFFDGKNVNIDFESIGFEHSWIHLQPGQSLDLGGVAKGWTVDKAAELMTSLGIENFLINAGGDLIARGVSDRGPWLIGVEGVDEILSLQDQALATSGAYKRNWILNGKKHHHILNSESGESSLNDLYALSVLTDSVAKSDAFATAAYSLGGEGAELLLQKNQLNYRLWKS